MSLVIRPGISVLINNITDLEPNVNLLLGANLFYSAYPAAQGKAGIYTKWGGKGGAEQAIKGIPHGVAPRSPTWRQAVDVLKARYFQFNPPGAGVTSVLMVPDTDNDSDKIQAPGLASAVINTSIAEPDKTAFGNLVDLLHALPTHVLKSACKTRPAARPEPNSTMTTTSAQRPPLAKPSSKTSTGNPVPRGSTTTKAPNITPFAHGQTPNTATASPTTTLAHHMASTTTAAPSVPPSTPVRQKTLTGGSNANTTNSCHPSAPQSPPPAQPSTSNSRPLIDSPRRGIGFAAFAVSKECYVLGYWTKTVLEFVGCDQEVIPIIESCLTGFANDEDDVGLQDSLSEEMSLELSHFVVNLLKLDAFLKSVGRYA